MCRNCEYADKWIAITFVVMAIAVAVFGVACAGTSSGAEVKAVPLAQINQTESPVIAKGLGIGRPEAHDIPKFELPPAGEAFAAGAVLLVIGQVVVFLVVGIAFLFCIVFLIRKLAPFGKVGAAVPKVIAGLDALVASHNDNFKLAKAVHARLSKVMVLDPITPPKKAPTRKKKANVVPKTVS